MPCHGIAKYHKAGSCPKFKTDFIMIGSISQTHGIFYQDFLLSTEDCVRSGSYLLVLLRLLPTPPPLQGFPFQAFIHQGVKGFAKHEISIVETPHTCTGGERNSSRGLAAAGTAPSICWGPATCHEPGEAAKLGNRGREMQVSQSK